MEDLSTLVWIGIAIVWFLAKLIRRGAKKVAQSGKKRPRPVVSTPAPAATESSRTQFGSQPSFSGRGGTGPPPIVPR